MMPVEKPAEPQNTADDSDAEQDDVKDATVVDEDGQAVDDTVDDSAYEQINQAKALWTLLRMSKTKSITSSIARSVMITTSHWHGHITG